MESFEIKVPASSANLGPGFDVLGVALSKYLTLSVTIDNVAPGSGSVTLSYEGEGANDAPLDPYKNLITRVALYVLRSHNKGFPDNQKINIHVNNQVPFGRGLGSSAAAVIAGVSLGNEIGHLNLSKERLKDYALMVERHPDNITAALYGGFSGSFLRMLNQGELSPESIPLAEVLPEYPPNARAPQQGDPLPPQPPLNIGKHVQYPVSNEVGVIVSVPQFELQTAKARGALPDSYSRQDVVFNLQRMAILTAALSTTPLDANMIWESMRDRIHQPARESLIPGLKHMLNALTPESFPGLLGVALSGAGPTLLTLLEVPQQMSKSDQEQKRAALIEKIKHEWSSSGNIDVECFSLDIDKNGLQVTKK